MADTHEPEVWREIAGLARALCALDARERQEYLEDFCRRVFRVPACEFFPLHRNVKDIAERPGQGPAKFLEYVASLGQPIIATGGDLTELAAQGLPRLLTEMSWSAFLLAPLALPGRAVGVLCLADDAEREFSVDEVAQLEAIVAQVASVMDAITLAEETRYKDAYSRALGEIDTMIASYDVTEILRFGVRKVHETIQAEKVLVFIVNQETGAVRLSVAAGCPYMREADFGLEPCAQLAMQALTQRTLQWVHGGELKALKGAKIRELCQERQAIAVPIMANNHVFGVLSVFERQDRRPFHRNEVGFVVNVAAKLALVIQNTQAYLTINRLNESLEEKVRDRTVQLEQAITTLKETQAQLMQTEKLATVGTLAGGVAHELNNPLAAVLANVQLLLLDAAEAETRESLALIEAGARRCKAIVANLLNFSRQATPEPRSLSLNLVVQESIDLLQHRVKEIQGTLALDLGELPPVIGNANELGQIVTNLLVNALDAIAEVEAPRHLAVRSAVEGQQIVLEVRDNGPGIDPLVISKVFDPFFTTKPVGKGTGLGLSVCQQIAGAHGGRIEVESTPGTGCLFRLRLPAAHGAIAKVEA